MCRKNTLRWSCIYRESKTKKSTWMLLCTTVARLLCNLPKSYEFRGKNRHVENLVCYVTTVVLVHGGLATALRNRAKSDWKDSRAVAALVMWNRLWLGHIYNFTYSWHVPGYHVNQNAKLTQNTSYKSERKHGPHLCMCKRWLNYKIRSDFLSTLCRFNVGFVCR